VKRLTIKEVCVSTFSALMLGPCCITCCFFGKNFAEEHTLYQNILWSVLYKFCKSLYKTAGHADLRDAFFVFYAHLRKMTLFVSVFTQRVIWAFLQRRSKLPESLLREGRLSRHGRTQDVGHHLERRPHQPREVLQLCAEVQHPGSWQVITRQGNTINSHFSRNELGQFLTAVTM